MPIYEKKKIMYEINKFESGKGGWYVVRVMHVHECKKKSDHLFYLVSKYLCLWMDMLIKYEKETSYLSCRIQTQIKFMYVPLFYQLLVYIFLK